MLELLRGLIGNAPVGLEFLEYIFAFFLTAFGLLVVAYVAHLPLEWIGSFHKRNK